MDSVNKITPMLDCDLKSGGDETNIVSSRINGQYVNDIGESEKCEGESDGMKSFS